MQPIDPKTIHPDDMPAHLPLISRQVGAIAARELFARRGDPPAIAFTELALAVALAAAHHAKEAR